MYRAPCWTNRILTFFLFISLQLSLPYIRGVKLRANPPDLAGAYRTRLGLSTCISALQGPGRHSFLPPHTHALFLTPFFFSSSFSSIVTSFSFFGAQPPAPLLGGALIVFFSSCFSLFFPSLPIHLFTGIAL